MSTNGHVEDHAVPTSLSCNKSTESTFAVEQCPKVHGRLCRFQPSGPRWTTVVICQVDDDDDDDPRTKDRIPRAKGRIPRAKSRIPHAKADAELIADVLQHVGMCGIWVCSYMKGTGTS